MSSNKDENLNGKEEDFVMEEDEEDDDEMPCSEMNPDNQDMQIDVEGHVPSDPDWRGISRLLQKVFLNAHINLEEMAEIIIKQNFIGSVIRQYKSDRNTGTSELDTAKVVCDNPLEYYRTIFGITTVLNINDKDDVANKICLQQFRAFLIEKAEKYTNNIAFKYFCDALNNETRPIGYLINERFLNIPPKISIPLLENLQQEITVAKEKNYKFNFVYFLMIIKMYRKEANDHESKQDFYVNAEEELIVQKAIDSFEYSVVGESDTDNPGECLGDLIPYRKIILYNAKDLQDSIVDIRKHITGDAI